MIILREIIKQLAYNYKSFGLDIISSEHINYHFILWNSKYAIKMSRKGVLQMNI